MKIDATLKVQRLGILRRSDGTFEHELNPAPGSVRTELAYTFDSAPAVGDQILDVLLVGFGPARITGRSWLRGHLLVACTVLELPPADAVAAASIGDGHRDVKPDNTPPTVRRAPPVCRTCFERHRTSSCPVAT